MILVRLKPRYIEEILMIDLNSITWSKAILYSMINQTRTFKRNLTFYNILCVA